MQKRYLIIGFICLLVLTLGASVAYFSVSMTGEEKTVTVSSKELKIVFTDNDAITANNISPNWTTSKTFTVQNLSNEVFYYDIQIEDLINTFETTGYLQYKIESNNNGYNTNNEWVNIPKSSVATDTTVGSGISIPVGVTQSYILRLRYLDSGNDQNVDQGKTFSGRLKIIEHKPTLVSKVLELNTTRLTRSDYSSELTTSNTNTLYTTTNTEDGSTVYYFAGNALNNWVKFGKCTSTSYNCTVGDDLYWRIIRTNTTIEDGGIRLLYAGSGSVAATNAYVSSGSTRFNETSNNPMYAGYMWGESGSLNSNRTTQTNKSNAATLISSWYTGTFNNSSDNKTKDSSGNLLTNYISPTAIYCNDRSVGSGTYNVGNKSFYFAGWIRLQNNKTPSLACGASTGGYGSYFEGGITGNVADKFTGSETNSAGATIGNGRLEATPAALMTADELVFAGGSYGINAPNWYHYNAATTPGSITSNKSWWTMTPGYWNGSAPFIFTELGYGVFSVSSIISNNHVLRPVISFKSTVLWASGDGSPSNPYEVKIN